jgi:hypothetical protein
MGNMRNFIVEIPGAAGEYVKRSAEQKQTTPWDIVGRSLGLSAAVDEFPDTEEVVVNRITGATRHLIIAK